MNARLNAERKLLSTVQTQGTRELRKKDARFNGFTLEYLKLSNAARVMNLASDSLKIGKTVNMNTERCTAAFDVLVRKLSDADNIANAIKV